MKKFLFSFLVLLVYGCLEKAVDKRDLKIINNSRGTIYYFLSESNSFSKPYINYTANVINEDYTVNRDTFKFIINKPIDWEESIFDSEGGKIRLFIISKDTIDKYGLKQVLRNNLYSKVYMFTLDDLNEISWEVIYKEP